VAGIGDPLVLPIEFTDIIRFWSGTREIPPKNQQETRHKYRARFADISKKYLE
jgi:hypothetical protein